MLLRFSAIAIGLSLLAACGESEDVTTADTAPASSEDTTADTADTGGADEAQVVEVESIEAMDDAMEYAFVGVWAADPAWCGIEPGSADPSPIEIGPQSFQGLENDCRITGIQPLELPDTYRLSRVCTGEGVETSDEIEIAVSGDTLTLTQGESETAFQRCP